ncbi:MAG TPA: PilZ domain-containing protein [Hyphomicrobiaceae bacterium]|nr:PilZ domain-containing protein [Hyphomicrobiaceae bacterium]
MANPILANSNVVQFGAPAVKADEEHRCTARRRTLKSGIIAYNNRFCTLPCTVRDLSATGARLRVDGSISAPDRFELIVESDGVEASCEVVWRKLDELGVRFIGAPRQVTAKKAQVVHANVPAALPSLRRKPKSS